jgi:hypothetical protein
VGSAARRKNICLPSFRNRFFFPLRVQFSLPRLRALNESTLLGMKLAQHTARLPLIDHASALPPPARITRPILPTSGIGSRFCRRCTAHAGREVPFAVGVAIREFEFGVRSGFPRSYSNGSRTSDRSRGRHGVMRLDWIADPTRYRNSVLSR